MSKKTTCECKIHFCALINQKELKIIKDALETYHHGVELDIEMAENIGTAYEYPYIMEDVEAIENKVQKLWEERS